MNISDLKHIFKNQKDKLFFMLIDGDHKMIERWDRNDYEGLLVLLDNFNYIGTSYDNIPRFEK